MGRLHIFSASEFEEEVPDVKPSQPTSRECKCQSSDHSGPFICQVQLSLGCIIHVRLREDIASKYTYLCEDFYMDDADEFDEEFESLLFLADEL